MIKNLNQKHPLIMEFVYGFILFIAMFGLMWVAVDTLASDKGDYVGTTAKVTKK